MNSIGKPLHVAFYMHDLSGGGVERMRLSLIAALRAHGIVVSLVLGRRRGPLERELPADLPVVDLQASRTMYEIPGLARFLRQCRPDILVSSLDHNNIAALIAHAWSGLATRLVICQHNALSAERSLGWKYRLVPLAYKLLHHSADAIVAVSRGVANDLCDFANMPRSKISVIYNPVIGPDFAAQSDGAAPHPWFVARTCPVFVFIGRLTAQKDAVTLLLAMQRLLRRQKARLILVGAGEDLGKLRSMAEQRDIGHAVEFVGFQSNPLPWIRHADALVSPSRYEGLGNAIIEALACGTPVIATDCPHGPAEILLEGALGTLVPVGDFEALAEAMARVGHDNADQASLTSRATAFTASACAAAHIKLFEKVVAGRNRSVQAFGVELSPLRADQVADTIVCDHNPQSVKLMVTPNIDHVRLLRRRDFAAAYATAHFVCPDGFPVLLYARMRGLHLTTRVTGCDVFKALLRHPDLAKHRIYCLVESAATMDRARDWFAARDLETKVEIACAQAGLARSQEGQVALVQRICDFAPTILVLTLGAPVSEEFAHRHRHLLPPCWILCVGQALRIELNLVRRAPPLWRRLGLEWLWRVCSEPARLSGRYARALLWFPVAIWHDLLA
jgi:exopolysaccharide biosynthesis WecB/TagA/CpsF family protein